jgi:hypothetical protein
MTRPGDTPMNNSSFFTADRATHMKIVVVSLIASIIVIVVGITARPQPDTTASAQVYRPGKAMVATGASGPADVR